MNEYSSLKDGALYSWGELGPGQFFLRLGGLWLVTFTALGVPIAAASFNPSRVSSDSSSRINIKTLHLDDSIFKCAQASAKKTEQILVKNRILDLNFSTPKRERERERKTLV